jgi:phosphoenolpyruvate-protein phosphotransferase
VTEKAWSGTAASPGVALGRAWRFGDEINGAARIPHERREGERDAAVAALAAAAGELHSVAQSLDGPAAEIVETGALMGEDPVLIEAVARAIMADGVGAAEAIRRATAEHAELIAGLGDERLAARADDVHSLGRRAARLAAGQHTTAPPGDDLILVAHDLGPGDVAEFASALAGIALAGGGPTAHAAIVPRSLGIPMVTGLYEGTNEIPEGASVVVDGSGGRVVIEPSTEGARGAKAEMHARRLAAQRAHELRDQPAMTSDGTRVVVLANVASRGELDVGLRAGAEGIGLLRTELAFLDAHDWPTEQEHYDALQRILDGLDQRPAVVRVLDFGADKSPPFLRDIPQRGIELLLAHPAAFVAQLRALLLGAQRHDLRVLLPMVQTAAEVTHASGLLEQVAAQLGIDRIPPLGSMIETPEAAEDAAAIAARSDFLSIGTNDLTSSTLGADRFAANAARAHHPRVLRSIARTVAAAHQANIQIEVCGEAASDPIMLPLLVGLGIDELSVGAARVGPVRDWIRQLSAAETAGLARSALTMDTAEEVEWAVRPLAAERALVT